MNNKENTMLDKCGKCKYLGSHMNFKCLCLHSNNQKYKLEQDSKTMPVFITKVPSPCIFKDTRQRKKVILHIPHSSTYLPESFRVLEGVSLERELQRMTDWFTDELFDFDEATKLIFPYSRLYCDVERFRQDKDEPMARYGMGVCYTNTSYGTELREISGKEKIFIKSSIYDEHHKKLELLVDDELQEQGSALIIDCHSFSNIPLPHEDSRVRPDICLGVSVHTPAELLIFIQDYFKKEGLSVVVDRPFSGTMVPLKFYGKDKRVKSIMIEINRKLYLDDKFEKNQNFYVIKELIHDVLRKIN